MEYVERQAKWIKENRIVKGSIVRVTRVADDAENGWNNVWVSWVNGMGTGVYEVESTDGMNARGILLRGVDDPIPYRYPYFVLEHLPRRSKNEN